MKKLSIYTLLLLLFAACTPKTGEKMTDLKDKSEGMEEAIKEARITEAFRKGAPAPTAAPKIELGEAKKFKLDNGLRVIVVENHKLPRVSFQLFIDAPVVAEGDKAGYIDLAGQLLNKGTKTKTKAEIDEAVDFIGASLSTSSSGFYAESLTRHTDKILAIAQDVLINPSFPVEEFDKAKKQTISGLAQAQEDPNSIAANVGAVLRYGKDHPYGQITTQKTVEDVKLEDCKAYYENYFQPHISYLVIVGDITPEAAKLAANKYFGAWKKTNAVSVRGSFPEAKKPGKRQVDFVDKAGAVQSVINVTYPVDLKPGAPDAIKARVMNTAFGGYFRSRLNNNLREDKAYTYGARSTLSSDRLVGSFRAYSSVRNEVTDSSLVQFLYEMERIRKTPLDNVELTLVKNVMNGSFARSLESPETVARFALNTARYNLPADYYNTYLEKLAAVSANDILTMAQKYITPDNAHILVVGSKSDVKDKLALFAPDGNVNSYDAYGNEVKELTSMMPVGMTAEKVLEDYINAIGGKKKISGVKSIKSVMTGDTQMGQIMMTTVTVAPDKFAMMIGAGGMTIQQIVVDGNKGKMNGMGGSKDIPAEEIEDYKDQATPFIETKYAEMGYKIELKEVEALNGKQCYVILITDPKGQAKTEYFDMANGLKTRTVQTVGEGAEAQTSIYDYADYKAVSGIKMPHTTTATGMMPMPLTLKAKSIEINGTIEDAIFKMD